MSSEREIGRLEGKEIGRLEGKVDSVLENQILMNQTLTKLHDRQDKTIERLAIVEEKQKQMYRDMGIIGTVTFGLLTGVKFGLAKLTGLSIFLK